MMLFYRVFLLYISSCFCFYTFYGELVSNDDVQYACMPGWYHVTHSSYRVSTSLNLHLTHAAIAFPVFAAGYPPLPSAMLVRVA